MGRPFFNEKLRRFNMHYAPHFIRVLSVLCLASLITGCAQRRYWNDMSYETRNVRDGVVQGREVRSPDKPGIIIYDYSEGGEEAEVVRAEPVPMPPKPERKERERVIPEPAPAPRPVVQAADDPTLPPNAKPGECYARVFVPPVYETVEERVMVQEASQKVEVLPAEYEWVEEQVLVKEASEQLEVIPAKYDWVEEDVLVSPASTKIETIPAEYEWVEEEVLVKPARTEWKKGTGPIEKLDNATGEIMCLVEVPAEYKTVRKQVLKQAAMTKTVDIPAQYETVRKRVMVSAPSTRTTAIPEEYETLRVKKMVKPEREVTQPIEPEYQMLAKEVLVKEGRTQWKRVLCETNLRPTLIVNIQKELLAKGYSPGDQDGVLGQQTLDAVKNYQRENGLAVGGLTMEVLQHLGVSTSR
jgi:hypothetical protein